MMRRMSHLMMRSHISLMGINELLRSDDGDGGGDGDDSYVLNDHQEEIINELNPVQAIAFLYDFR